MKKLESVSFLEARELALRESPVTKQVEIVMIDNALYRVLAEDIICQKNLPSFNNSAMDGFAFRYEDKGKKVKIISTIFAGDKPASILEDESCYKIMTGAQVPNDADTIVPIEDCKDLSEEYVTLPLNIKKGNAFRFKGEEQKKGSVLFKKGELITPAHIAMLSSQGIVALKVYKELKIAIVSTGNEIKEPWDVASEDEIYNANAFGIDALLKKFGFKPTYLGAVPDSLEESVKFIENLTSYDVIITTGGISMGDADFLEEAFLKNSLQVLFHGVNVKPGRPTMMGLMRESFVMAMPGNPLTAMLNTFLLSLPILFKIQGSKEFNHSFVYAKNSNEFKAKSGRTNIVLGKLEDGNFFATRENKYGSGMLTPIVESNCLAILGEDKSGAKEGEILKVIPFDSFPLSKSNNNIN